MPITLVAPDLQVTGLSVQPGNPVSGSTVTLSWNDTNTGDGATDTGWVDSVSVVNTSTGQTLATGTVPYDAASLGALQPGGSAAQQFAFTLPDGDPGVGNLAITVTTNATNSLIEGNSTGTAQTNNTATASAVSALADYPDLTVPQVSISPANPQSGDEVTVTWSDANSGRGAATQSFDDSVVVENTGTDQIIASGTIPYDETALGDVAVGTSTVPRQYTFQLPAGLPGVGTFQITVTTDSSNQIFEYDYSVIPGGHQVAESNNSTSINEVSTLAPYPDLQVADVTGPATAFNSQAVLVSWTDENEGTNTATGPWVDDVYAATDAQGDNPTLLGSFEFDGTLAVGASAQLTQQVNLPSTPGTYWLMVTTNATQSVQEGANFGNDTTVATSPIGVSATPLPDLVVSSITPPPNGVFSGTSVPISFVVTNQGTAPTSVPVWHDWVIVSQDPTLGPDLPGTAQREPVPAATRPSTTSRSIEGFVNPSYLGVGQSYEQNVDVTLPITAQGTWYVYVVPDGTGLHHPFAMPELSRTDKLAISAGFSVTLSPPPELDVTSVTAPAENFSGQPMNLSWTVSNIGTGPTDVGTWTDAVYMSPDPMLDSKRDGAGDVHAPRGAGGRQQLHRSQKPSTCRSGSAGRSTSWSRPTCNGQVFQDGATAYNVAPTFTPVTVNLTPPPDLEISSITVPATAVAGHGLTFSYTTTNAGAGATPNDSWTDSFYLSPTPTYDSTTAISVGSLQNGGALIAGSSYTNTFTATVPNGLTGAYYVLVDTDSGNVVFELDKANNWGSSSGTVQISQAPPDLVVSSASAPSLALEGSAILVNWTIANQGGSDTFISSWQDDVYVDPDSMLDSNAVLLGSFTHTGLLNPGDSYSQSQLVTLPIDLLGSYNVFVVADASGGVPESNTANNDSAPLPIKIEQTLTPGGGGGRSGGGGTSGGGTGGISKAGGTGGGGVTRTEQAPVSDLQPTSISGPGMFVAGGSLTLAWTVTNNGPGVTNSNHWIDDLWISTNPTLGNGGTDVLLGSVQHTNPLVAGAGYSASGTFTVPRGTAAGNYYYIVQTNASGLVYEDNSLNDELASSTTAVAAPGPMPELNVSDVTVPSTATSGGQLSVGWTVTNTGGDTQSVPITDSVYLSYDQYFDPSDRYLGSVSYQGRPAEWRELHPKRDVLAAVRPRRDVLRLRRDQQQRQCLRA